MNGIGALISRDRAALAPSVLAPHRVWTQQEEAAVANQEAALDLLTPGLLASQPLEL